jgi:hypothetical protein
VVVSDQNPNGERGARTILLLGSARSGTTWLAKLLDTHPGVLYLHEPLLRLKATPAEPALRRLVDGGELDAEETALLWGALCRTRFECLRPPFFPKSFLKLPPWAIMVLRRAAGYSRRGRRAFGDWLTPAARLAPDLLIKEVDWQDRALNIVRGLHPGRVVFIVRHPCAVVHSRLRGLKMGVIPGHDRVAWLVRSAAQCEAIGISERQVHAMPPWEFYALDWLLQNLYYCRIAEVHPRTTTVLYRDLCLRPEQVTADVFRFLGWEVNSRTSRFIRTSTHSRWRALAMRLWGGRRGYYNLYRDGSESLTDWKNSMPPEQQEGVLKIARLFPHMDWWAEPAADAAAGDCPEGAARSCPARP